MNLYKIVEEISKRLTLVKKSCLV